MREHAHEGLPYQSYLCSHDGDAKWCVQAGEAQAEHEQQVQAFQAEIESLRKHEEMSSVLIGDMQQQLDENAHSQAELKVLPSALTLCPV